MTSLNGQTILLTKIISFLSFRISLECRVGWMSYQFFFEELYFLPQFFEDQEILIYDRIDSE